MGGGKILGERRYQKADADRQVVPAKTVVVANRCVAVCWRPGEYPAGANGVEALRVSTTPFDPSSISPLAGVVLETATNDWTLVLTRGLYQMRVDDGEIVNALDLVASNGGTRVFPAGRGTNAAPVLGTALSWQHTPPGLVWVYVNPAAFYGMPRLARSIGSLGGNVTTASTSYVDLAVFGSRSVKARFAWLEILLTGVVSNGGAGNTTFITFSVDGVDLDEPVWAATVTGKCRAGRNQRRGRRRLRQCEHSAAADVRFSWRRPFPRAFVPHRACRGQGRRRSPSRLHRGRRTLAGS